MRKTLLTLLLVVAALTAMAQESRTHLVVWAKDGSQVAYSLTEQPLITFNDSVMRITTSLIEVNYPLATMACYTFETRALQTGWRDLKTDEPIAHFVGESLIFPQLEANTTVAIYSPVGQLLFSRTVSADGEYAFPLSYLNTGVYLIQVQGVTYKIVKR